MSVPAAAGLTSVASLVTPSPTPSATPTDLTGSLATGDIGPGWVAAIIVLVVILATVGLMFSMRRQMRKITFVEEPEPGVRPGEERPVWPARPTRRPKAPNGGKAPDVRH